MVPALSTATLDELVARGDTDGHPRGYIVVLRAAAGESEPFEAIELGVSALFGDDD